MSLKRLVVKIGTSLLTRKGGRIDTRRIARLASELAALRKSGIDVLLVTSGAIAAGTGELGWSHKPQAMGQKQAAAAVGQIRLMEYYRKSFSARGVTIGQILLTREDFENKTRAQNAHVALSALLQDKVIPIINENDTVAMDEIRLGDNDTLASFVAVLVKADLLILLTDVDGLMTPPPGRRHRRHYRSGPGGGVTRLPYSRWQLIPMVDHIGPQIEAIAHAIPGSDGGTGGMMTKIKAAKRATAHGVEMVIASGKRAGLLGAIVRGEPVGTLFAAKRR